MDENIKELIKSELDRLQYEYEIFYLDMITTSKENIYSHAEEICQKEKVYNILYSLFSDENNFICWSEYNFAKLSSTENVIDAVYRCVCNRDMNKNAFEDTVRRQLLTISGVNKSDSKNAIKKVLSKCYQTCYQNDSNR